LMLMLVSACVVSSIAHVSDRVLSLYVGRSLLSLVFVVGGECNAQTRPLVLVALLCTRALCLLLAGPSVPLRASSPRWCRPSAFSSTISGCLHHGSSSLTSLRRRLVLLPTEHQILAHSIDCSAASQPTTSSHSGSPIKPSHFQPQSHEHAAFSRKYNL
jgi:hypothetical protein